MDQQTLFTNQEPEQENIEFKTASKGELTKSIWEPVTAFSNAEGGTILFGVRPDGSFEPLSSGELDKLQRSITTNCSNEYSHRLYPEITTNKGTLKVYIPPAPAALRPIYSKSRGCPRGAKVRVGSSNVQVDDEWMRRFSIAASGGGAEAIAYDASVEVLDEKLLHKYIDKVNKIRGDVYQGMDTLEVLQKLRVLDKNKNVTLFGLLAFSKDASLQELVSPTINIAITHYRGATKPPKPEAEDDPFETNKEFFGPVSKQFEEAFRYLLSMLPIKGTIEESGKRKDYFVIPEKAIREVLANAIAHRDYAVHTSRIQIDIYSDRVEFINPGRSLVPIAELDTTPSFSRNPILMNYMKDMGYTEQRARGIKTIKDAIKNAGLLEPRFTNTDSSFVATLYSSAFISSDDQEWLNKFSSFGLNDRQLNALAHLKNTPQGISNSEYRDINGMDKVRDDKKANRDLKRLVELDLLKKAGENKSTRYYLSKKLS